MASELWEAISPPPDANRITLRRVDAAHRFDFYRGRDHAGRYLFVLQGGFAERREEDLPRLAGIETEIARGAPQGAMLRLTLLEQSQSEIFGALCENLMRATERLEPGDYESAVDAIVSRLRRWQDLLRRRREDVLSREQEIGLVGELLVLRDLFLPHLSASRAMTCWRGPSADEQDFQVGAWLVEVKTKLSSSDSQLSVASEHQLDTASGRIALCHQRLASAELTAPDARSLNSLVEEIRERIAAEPVAVDRFESILIDAGFESKPAYSDPWLLTSREYFVVKAGFPRILASALPAGVSHVRYEVSLDACRPFGISTEELLREVFSL